VSLLERLALQHSCLGCLSLPQMISAMPYGLATCHTCGREPSWRSRVSSASSTDFERRSRHFAGGSCLAEALRNYRRDSGTSLA
jgi:hypothetical protein